MYKEHFRFVLYPFSIAPDPNFLFLSDAHNEALAHLMYGFSHGGFVMITGEVGTGKTTLLRNLLDRTPPDLDVAFILNPRLTVRELLETLCEELGVHFGNSEPQSIKQYIDAINKHLLRTHRAGRSTVVIIDEAQNLSPAVLEQIRLLTNLETNERKLLRIILLGQPELAEMLSRTELRQLAQRITARYHLTPLKKTDVEAYVTHRLARAGGNPSIFTNSAISALYRVSKGTPRLINVVADRALLGAYVAGLHQVDARLVKAAANEVFGNTKTSNQRYWLGASAVIVLIASVMAWAYFSPRTSSTEVSSEPAPAVPATTNPGPATAKPTTTPPATAAPSQPTLVDRTPAPTFTIADVSRPDLRTSLIHRNAYRAAFAAWGAEYPLNSSQIPCDFAPRVGLQCLSRKGSWSEVNQLNIPVVLELWDSQTSPYYGALVARTDDRYTLSLGTNTTQITPKDLRDHWFGSYVVLWQTPPDYHGSIRRGDDHPTVRWLQEKLNLLDRSLQLDTRSTFFDNALHDAVLAFQRDEGLLADGIVGPLTWIRLNARLELPAPSLAP